MKRNAIFLALVLAAALAMPAAAQPAGDVAPCNDSGGGGLCLNGNRFHVTVSWRIPSSGAQGTGTPIPMSADTGAFWFFQPSNYEIAVKVLDGRGLNSHFWVFFASLTDVEFDLTVTDTTTGQQRTYHNSAGTLASRSDTEAFPQ